MPSFLPRGGAKFHEVERIHATSYVVTVTRSCNVVTSRYCAIKFKTVLKTLRLRTILHISCEVLSRPGTMYSTLSCNVARPRLRLSLKAEEHFVQCLSGFEHRLLLFGCLVESAHLLAFSKICLAARLCKGENSLGKFNVWSVTQCRVWMQIVYYIIR